MRRLTRDQLRRSTLRRQFPDVPGAGPESVLDLVGRLGPIQSQVPRSPFLAASSRLPGVTYATVTGLFEEHRLVKASTLRGTVHTSTRDAYGPSHVVAATARGATTARSLGLRRVTPAALTGRIEEFCRDGWRTRDEVVADARAWLATQDAPETAAGLSGTAAESSLWGHSGLLRRPSAGAWETRTDVLRRTAASVLPPSASPGPEDALRDLVRGHLAAYGPVQTQDLVFFFGVTVRQAKTAVAALGDEVVRLPGPDDEEYLDLAEPPIGGSADPGIRLLPEFDGLLLGFCGRQRTRFLEPDQLARVWAKVNGLFSPVVLADGLIAATWRTVGTGRRPAIEVTTLPGRRPLDPADLVEPVRAVEAVLALEVSDVRVRPAS